jgi:hypothetical protein
MSDTTAPAETEARQPNARDRRRAASAAKRDAKNADHLARLHEGLVDSRLVDRHYGQGSGADRDARPDYYLRTR